MKLDCESLCAFQQWVPISKIPERSSSPVLKCDLCSLSSRGQYLFKNKPPDGTAPPNSFYRALYPKIIQDIEVRSDCQVWWAFLFCFPFFNNLSHLFIMLKFCFMLMKYFIKYDVSVFIGSLKIWAMYKLPGHRHCVSQRGSCIVHKSPHFAHQMS